MLDFIQNYFWYLIGLTLFIILLFLSIYSINYFKGKKNKRITVSEERKTKLINNLLPGDIILVADRDIVTPTIFFIRLANFFSVGFGKHIWNHAALYVGENKIVEAFKSGVVENNFSESYLNDKYDIVILRRINVLPEQCDKMINYCKNQIGTKYDLLALGYFVLVRILPPTMDFLLDTKTVGRLNNEKEFFCSELIAQGLLKAKIYCFGRAPFKIMPVDFFNEYCFEKVDEVSESEKDNIVCFAIWCMYVLLIILSVVIIPVLVYVWARSRKEEQGQGDKITRENKTDKQDKNTEEENLNKK